MSDLEEKKVETTPEVSPPAEEHVASTERPTGWMYRERKLGPITIPWYASPKVQLTMVSFVCFMCPGMFNALGGLGGGGKSDQTTADNMNIALYSTFAVFGFFGGSIVNRLGVKFTLAVGGLGYCIYAIALLVSVHSTHTSGFSIFAGALLGVCAGLLWTAQGTIMLSYPHEGSKGKYFAWFWSIFNLGGVIGALIPLGQNIHVKTNSTVTDGTYIAFIILMFVGAVIALFLCNASDVWREDDTRVVLMKNPTWKTELMGLYETILSEPYIILLFPMFWSSNWFTTYQTNAINGSYFDTRTKALNNVLYWSSQIIGAQVFGNALDSERFSRTVRAKACLVVLLVLTMVIWGGGYDFAKQYTRATVASADFVPMDWSHSGYVGIMFLYMFYGFYDAAWQGSTYWFMGALTNSGRKMANYVGFYKGIQSAGAAVMWSLDSRKVSFMAEFASNWALLTFSLLCAAPVIFIKVKDHVTIEEDLVFSDETLADVVPITHPEKVAV
ncbi:putative DUF895 membrane protein-1 [Coleophoma cylindrospora]|uniref:Putative DUF895 membrane protein-1 n=1 Tax=Coleophoma cylindrospora TaxID=1849047 RepID=A0A3D8RZX9_9HELO|nr:putative DUF895 membrane protein-1 [Coleophoma cylindrospora]